MTTPSPGWVLPNSRGDFIAVAWLRGDITKLAALCCGEGPQFITITSEQRRLCGTTRTC